VHRHSASPCGDAGHSVLWRLRHNTGHLHRPAQGRRPGLCRQGRPRLRYREGEGVAGPTETGDPEDPALRQEIAHRATWVEPSLLAEIEFRAKSAEGEVRHPFFEGIREDL
jgi:hypothetical protein